MSTAVRVCGVDDLEVDTALRVVVAGTPVAVVQDANGTVHAIGDTCTHGDISLAEGFVEEAPSSGRDDGPTLECWAHGSRFSLTSGRPLTLPAYQPVPVFRVTVEGADVLVDPTPIPAEELPA
ncbi:MAG TPA: non-heme iron oxygenase ferredoxin subunit [Amnibacterium sp.]|jgi:3-phenylpropionate/trans-cinnamate dioxygenase ferredoxin subunit|nr:non-heme iron oxygenase ferredoxin subunit [Amnibacterium sp.]